MSDEKKSSVKAGQNVIAKIGGKDVGPLYCVQIEGDKATLQGKETHVVPVEDCKPA